MTKMDKNYTELSKLRTLEERFDYLKLFNKVGQQSWGWDRVFNQRFYHSSQWKRVRDIVILRDKACDLGIPGFEIHKGLLIHHMNPIWIEDIRRGNSDILNPEFLIVVSERTHQAIHYGDKSLLPQVPIVRYAGDTKLWR
jgi:hypothetical protein